jgi:hypothetical protein
MMKITGMKITGVPRRVFMAGVGAALAQLASSAKAAVTERHRGAAHRRLGSVPKHIVPSPSNPYFQPVGPPHPVPMVRPTPPPYHGNAL